MKTQQQGFTLIELMIVVAIIGILAAIALPAYQDYIARSKLSEAMTQLDAAKGSVAEYVATNGSCPATTSVSGVNSPANAKYVKSLSVDAACQIGAEIQNTSTGVDTKYVVLTGTKNSDNTVTWTCGTTAVTADFKYLPSNCRTSVTFAAVP
ncbi:pilin [Algiphilus sp. W345]|uniref:Pilin n=1 Tax=Banduia mediterranea TaxID=3075609 RepID=A0ABU2WG85_9GAMM|nr:pilin [Algiphilus sp. W345]MDT0496875.1 pilin [Algiphilus sp. W345]